MKVASRTCFSSGRGGVTNGKMGRGAPIATGDLVSHQHLHTQVVIMAKATGIAVLCCALASCQAFLAPVSTSSSALSSGQHGSSRCYSRRPRTALSMKEEATTETDKVVVEGGSAATAAAEDAGKETGKKTGSKKQDLYKNQPKPVWT